MTINWADVPMLPPSPTTQAFIEISEELRRIKDQVFNVGFPSGTFRFNAHAENLPVNRRIDLNIETEIIIMPAPIFRKKKRERVNWTKEGF